MLWNQLDEMAKQLVKKSSSQSLASGTVGAVSLLLSSGYVVWCLRGGALVASVLSTLPAWLAFDPLPVLEFWEREEKHPDEDGDEQTLDFDLLLGHKRSEILSV